MALQIEKPELKALRKKREKERINRIEAKVSRGRKRQFKEMKTQDKDK